MSGLPESGGELPVAVLAEEILTPGEGQIRGLITICGNPVLSTPDGRQLDDALESLDFMVSIDIYLNETTRHADLILPPTSSLNHDHYDLIFNAFAIRNVARFNAGDLAAAGRRAVRLGDLPRARAAAWRRRLEREHKPLPATADVIEGLLAQGPRSRSRALNDAQHGIDFGPLDAVALRAPRNAGRQDPLRARAAAGRHRAIPCPGLDAAHDRPPSASSAAATCAATTPGCTTRIA